MIKLLNDYYRILLLQLLVCKSNFSISGAVELYLPNMSIRIALFYLILYFFFDMALLLHVTFITPCVIKHSSIKQDIKSLQFPVTYMLTSSFLYTYSIRFSINSIFVLKKSKSKRENWDNFDMVLLPQETLTH